MKPRLVHRTATLLAMLGIGCTSWLSPLQAIGAESVTSSSRPLSQSTILDTRLDRAGRLLGQVVDAEGRPQADIPINVLRGGKTLARVVTDSEGRFHVDGLSGGLIIIDTKGATALARVWTNEAAPPSAMSAILLVTDASIARGQILSDPYQWSVIGAGLLIGGVIVIVATDSASGS